MCELYNVIIFIGILLSLYSHAIIRVVFQIFLSDVFFYFYIQI